MSTRHVMQGSEFTARPSRQVLKRKLKVAETLGDFEMRPGYLYTVVRAISARVNQNYDGWPSEELKKSYKTFIGKPVFVNHENYDPAKARGVVVAARYVEAGDDKYVEVIQEIDAQRFPKLAHEIRTGGLDSVSMGAEAGFTICSYCGNKAQDVPDMCDHVLFHKGEKLSRFNRKTGKREEVLVYESCHKLSFFELSYVFDPADETAVASKVLEASKKTASLEWRRHPDHAIGHHPSGVSYVVVPDGDTGAHDVFRNHPNGDQHYIGPAGTFNEGVDLAEADDPSQRMGRRHTAAECPPGKDCTIHPQSEQISADSANNPLNGGGGGSAAAAGASVAQTPIDTSAVPGQPASTATPGGGIPLVQKPDGTWTSPDPAWAHLINRESGGNPSITQQIHDVNSGGNEAQGLFQITPQTWKSNGGGQYGNNPGQATPQQQAEVAKNIFTKNPSGSDWGAGLSGREDAAALSKGLSSPTTTTTTKDPTTAPATKAASFEDRVLKVAGFKQASPTDDYLEWSKKVEDGEVVPEKGPQRMLPSKGLGEWDQRVKKRQANKCHYCKGDAEEGFSSCTAHRPMEDQKFKAAVLKAAGFRDWLRGPDRGPGDPNEWDHDPETDIYRHPTGHEIRPSDELEGAYQLWAPTVSMSADTGPLAKDRMPSPDLQSHFDHVQRTSSFEVAVLKAAGWPFKKQQPQESPTAGEALTNRFTFEPHPSGQGYHIRHSPTWEQKNQGLPGDLMVDPTAPHGQRKPMHFPDLDSAVDHAMSRHSMDEYRDPSYAARKEADFISDFYGEPDPLAEYKRKPSPMDLMYNEWNSPVEEAAERTAGLYLGGPPPPAVPMTGIQSQEGMDPTDYVVPYKGRGYQPGMPVDIYRNLHSEKTGTGLWSIRHKGQVVGHSDFAHVPGGKFFVGEGGNAAVQESGQKNVHAGVRGVLGPVPPGDHGPYTGITYNPKAGDTSFITREGREPVWSADHVHLGPDGKAYTMNPQGRQTFEAAVLAAYRTAGDEFEDQFHYVKGDPFTGGGTGGGTGGDGMPGVLDSVGPIGPGFMPGAPATSKVGHGRHEMPTLPGRHEAPPDHDPRVPPGGFQVFDADEFLRQHPGEDAGPVSHRASFEARVLQAAGYEDYYNTSTGPGSKHMLDQALATGDMTPEEHATFSRYYQQMPYPELEKQNHQIEQNEWTERPGSFEARVLRAWGETEAPAAVDTLREEGSAPEDDNNDFYHYVEPPKELQAPDLSQAAQIDREQDQSGQAGMDGQPGPASPEMADPSINPAQPQQQYMELKIPLPSPGQAGAPGASQIPMQPYQAQPPAPAAPNLGAPVTPGGPPQAPEQQIAASTRDYMDRYFGRRLDYSREAMKLSNLSNDTAAFPTSRNPMKGTANMARSTLASRGKTVTAGRRQHFADGPLVDTGDQSHNDQGEQEEVFLSQTPPAEGVVTPKDGEEISNTENNLVAKVQRGRAQLLRDAQALANWQARHGKRRVAVEQAGGPVATEVDPEVNSGPGARELANEPDTIAADPNVDAVETQPKDASLHAFKQFDRWLAASTGKPCRSHSEATIKRAAADFSRKANVSVQALYPALGIVLREARKNEKAASKGAKMRKRADEKLEVAAPDGRINVEAPTEGTTDAEAQASQFDLHDFGDNAGDNIADPDLSTDQNWAPGEANKTSKVKLAGGILAFRLAEGMIAAGLEPNTAERKYALAAEFEHMSRGAVQDRIALCERFAAVLQNERRKVASGSTRGAALKPPVPANLGSQRTAGQIRVAANDPRNDSGLFI